MIDRRRFAGLTITAVLLAGGCSLPSSHTPAAEAAVQKDKIQSALANLPGVADVTVSLSGYRDVASAEEYGVYTQFVLESGADGAAVAKEVLHQVWTSTLTPGPRVTAQFRNTSGDRLDVRVDVSLDSRSLTDQDKKVQAELRAQYGPRPGAPK